MPSVPVFEQQAGSRIFALSTSAQAGVPGFWAGYCAAPGSSLSGTLSTTQIWQDKGGTYLVLGTTPADWAVFLSGFDALRPNLAPPEQLRLLWIENPDAPMIQWRLTVLQAQAQGSGATITWRTIRATGFRLGYYGLEIAGLGALTQIADNAGGGIAFAGGGAFLGPYGDAAFTADTLAMPFDGAAVASLTGQFTVPAASAGQNAESIWNQFGIGLCYAAPPLALDSEATPQQIAVQNATRLLFQSVFDGQPTAISAALVFDPLNPLAGARTHVSLAPEIGDETPALASFLRTTLGYPVTLTPLAAAGGAPDARFVFGAAPVQGSSRDDGILYHLSPDGAFQIGVVPPEGGSAAPYQLLTGLSGLEYVEISADSHQIVFAGDHPAFAIPAGGGAPDAPTVAEALNDTATTSHAAILPVGSVSAAVYFAQPRQAPIFSGKSQIAANFLDFNPMPAATLTASGTPPVFPFGAYAGLSSGSTALAEELENASIAPYRHFQIDTHYGERAKARHALAAGKEPPSFGPLRRVRDEADPLGVTPQGLVVELTPDYQDYDGVYIANMPNTDYPRLDFTVVTGNFKSALQSNQLFFVAANPDVLMQATSVRYELLETALNTALLLAKGVPQSIVTAVYAALSGKSQPFDTEADFVACIGKAATPTYLPVYLAMAGLLQAQMDGWTFQVSPRAWRPWRLGLDEGGPNGELEATVNSPTMMLAKFCSRSLSDLVADSSSWLWPEVAVPPIAGGTIGQTQRLILDIFASAATAEAGSPYRRFFDDVVDNSAWNGFLFLNAPVDIAEMPADLLFLTAGIDTERFYAHHLGLSQTPFVVAGTQPTLQNTAAFGLIDYNDPVDLYSEETVAFDFKTLQLRASFANSALTDFSAKAELLANRLFSDFLTKAQTEHGNNLVLDGGYQRVGTVAVYSFVLEGLNSYGTRASVLSTIDVSTVALQTRSAGSTAGQLVTDFTLSGTLQFGAPQAFDLYSFGPERVAEGVPTDSTVGLRYSGLVVSMQFALGGDAASKQFRVDEGNLSFDLANSSVRAQSLVGHFPLALNGLVAVLPTEDQEGQSDTATGTSPEDVGFTSVSAPLEQTPLAAPWYGLRFTLDLGTLGALLGSVGIGVEVLAAWQPGAEPKSTPPQYLGLRIDTGPAEGVQWPLQGVLSLGFRNFQFLTYIDENDALVYLLRLHQFTLSVLGLLNFPPGNNDIVLFGNPDQSGSSKLGWYAAYAKDTKEEEKAQARPGRVRLAAPAGGEVEPAPPPLRRQEKLRQLRNARSGRRSRGGPQ
ncbi:hypothetical protein DAH66_19785 [Sphingomonas koreensis]|uniref:Hemagglutinin protein n=1 Tax=Sphingomonas koreensis TaxID=93064 RepID=A0A430FYS0_9SPHN|nr:hypothetical protein [Sphingomonas koreensis]RSY77797.1 hypothetical protein DAH66_19785 [Sphingomonas koreensis]